MEQNDNRPLMVSIRCITYNHEPYIRQCLEGFVMQKTNFRFEAIVHDDASTDGTAAIIREYAEKYPDIIKPIYETENQHSKRDGSLRRIMNAACKGKYTAYCEGDDYWVDPYKLQKQVDILESDDKVSMVYTSFKTVDPSGQYMFRPEYEKYKKMSFSGDVLTKLILSGNFIMTLTICIRSNISNNELLNNPKIGLDYLIFLTAASMGNVVYIPEETGCYRFSPQSMMNANRKGVEKLYMDVKKWFAKVLLESQIKQYPLKKRISVRIALLENSFLFYKNKADKEYLSIVLSKRWMLFFLPFALWSYAIKKVTNKKA